MTDKWTPGPWMVDQRAATHVVGAGGRHVCTTGGYSSNHPSDRDTHIDENEANAALIAAAPELVEALRRMLDRWQACADLIDEASCWDALWERTDDQAAADRARALLDRIEKEANGD